MAACSKTNTILAAILATTSILSTTSAAAYGSRAPWVYTSSSSSARSGWDGSGESDESGEHSARTYLHQRPQFSSFYPSFPGYDSHKAFSYYIQTPSFTYNFNQRFPGYNRPQQNYNPSPSFSSFPARRPSIFGWTNPQQFPSSSRTNDDGTSLEETNSKTCLTDLDCDVRRFEVCDANYGSCRVCFPRHFCGKRRGENCGSDFHCSGEAGLICRLSTCVCRDDLFDTVDGCMEITALSNPGPSEVPASPEDTLTVVIPVLTNSGSSGPATSTEAPSSSTPSQKDIPTVEEKQRRRTTIKPITTTTSEPTTTAKSVDSTPLPPAITSSTTTEATTTSMSTTTTTTTMTPSPAVDVEVTTLSVTKTAMTDETTVKMKETTVAIMTSTTTEASMTTLMVDVRGAGFSTTAGVEQEEKFSTLPPTISTESKEDSPDAEVVPTTTEQQPEFFGVVDDDVPLGTISPEVAVVIPGDEEVTEEPTVPNVTTAADGDVRESSTPRGTEVEEKSMTSSKDDTDRGVNFVDLSQVDLRGGTVDGSTSPNETQSTDGALGPVEDEQQTPPTVVLEDTSNDFVTRNETSDMEDFGMTSSPDADASMNEV